MSQTNDFLNRAAEKNGFVREKYQESKIPTENVNITIFPFFGDLESCFILSALLLKRYREANKGSKYFIIASWPGLSGLFPYVDEYWAISDKNSVKTLYNHSEGFVNYSEKYTLYLLGLNEFFRDVVDYKDFKPYYSSGLKTEFFDKYKQVVTSLPMVPSTALLGKEFNKELMTRGGYKIFLSPTQQFKSWRMGKTRNLFTSKEFWVQLTKKIIKEKMTPIIWNSSFSYDISSDMGDLLEKCIFIAEDDISRVLSAMRACGFVLDVFSGLSRLAIAARCPFLSVEERSRFINEKVYEIDDLCSSKLPKQYYFSFASAIKDGVDISWDLNLFNGIFNRINSFIPELNRESWPSTGEIHETVSYSTVRKRKLKQMGCKFIKIEKI